MKKVHPFNQTKQLTSHTYSIFWDFILKSKIPLYDSDARGGGKKAVTSQHHTQKGDFLYASPPRVGWRGGPPRGPGGGGARQPGLIFC